MTLSFEPPSHGWMNIHVDGHHLVVSDVPCDSLMMLMAALSGVLSGSVSERVEWSLEPDYAVWIFDRVGDDVAFSLKEDSESPVNLIAKATPLEVVGPIVSALSVLAECEVWADDAELHEVWSWPFPKMELSKLRNKRAEHVVSSNGG